VADIDAIASEIASALVVRRAPARLTGLSLQDAYRVTAALDRVRQARGERPIGRKIGFTNRTIWPEYGVDAPNWGYLTDRSVSALEPGRAVSLQEFAEPRIEPEIVFGLSAAPSPEMDEAALTRCIGWVAHGFEIVHSIFPSWKFTLHETTAANALHGALLLGPRQPLNGGEQSWLERLATFDIALYRNGQVADRGKGENVLGSPVSALRHVVQLLADDDANPPLAAGEIVSTGTLTRALPIAPGEIWKTELSGIELKGIEVRFC
jgi:2-oxo-3-hexenedioate decarboxylase